MKLLKNRSTGFAFVLWIFFLWMLHGEVVSQSFLTKDAYIDINDGALIMRQDYLGFYLGNKKIGYSRFILKEDNDGSPTKLPGKYYRFESDAYMKVDVMGIPMSIITEQKGEVNEDLSLRTFRFSYTASGQRLDVLVDAEKDGLHVTTNSEGNSKETIIPTSGSVYHADMIHLLVARAGLEAGKQYTFPVFEAMTLSYTPAIVKVESKDTLQTPDGKPIDTYRISISLKGINSTSWINTDGDLYKESSSIIGIQSTALRETLEQATDMNYISEDIKEQPAPETDMIKASRILIDPPIQNYKNVSKMVVELEGVTSKQVIIDDNYQFSQGFNNDTLTLRVQQIDYPGMIAKLPNEKSPYPPVEGDLAAYLDDEPLVQSKDPRIREKALEITQSSETRWQAARAIAEWLYQTIKKENRVTVPSALEVFNSMKGDCNEHSTLFCAMARSIGLPAKICAGLVYQEDGFYYHAWNEVYAGGQWLPIDATLDRIEMDAAHIKLAEGSLDSQTDILGLVGNVKVKILSVEWNES